MHNETQVNRRQVLAVGAAAAVVGAAVAVAGASARSARAIVSAGQRAGRRLVVLTAADVGFADALDRLFPGLRKDPGFQAIQATTAMVTNEGAAPIKALAATWWFTTSNGVHEMPVHFFARSRSGLRMTAQQAVFRAGQTRLVSPFFRWSPERYAKFGAANWARIAGRTEDGRFLTHLLPSISLVQLTIDAVIYADWTLVGSNLTRLDRDVVLHRDAEHDEAVAVHQVIRSGGRGGAVRQLLRRHLTVAGINGTDVPRPRRFRHAYFHARTVHARSLLRSSRAVSREAFVKAIEFLVSQPRTRVTTS